MFEIIPSPGTENKDWSEIEKKIEIVKPFTKTLHIDLVDGKFAENKTFLDPTPFKKYNDLLLEVHLMVEEPLQYIKPWADVGVKRFIGQVEKMSDQAAFVAEAEQYGEVGLALDGPTSLDAITVPYIDLDCVLIMTIKAGSSGQEFQEKNLEKIVSIADTAFIPIAVDGGINEKTIQKAYNAGARRFTVTSALFNDSDPQGVYRNLEEICEELQKRESLR